MITTTLNRIRAHSPCLWGWVKLLSYLGKTKADDEALPFSVILESNGLGDATWCCVAEPQYNREWRLFAVWSARKVQHLMGDPRSIAALYAAENHANGLTDDGGLAAAGVAAWGAVRAGRQTAMGPVRDAANVAARTADRDAWGAVRPTAWDVSDAKIIEFLRVVTEAQNKGSI